MIISHNIQALNTNRIANTNFNLYGKSLEKVSSGYKINRVGDNPMGLAMSETMRRQIRGLNQGIENTKAAINLCQTADGALSEITEMLQRLNKLSVQSETATNSSSDRQEIQAEVKQLLVEIDRIADTTTFNEIYIFKGKDSLTESIGSVVKPSTSGKFFQLFGDDISKTGYMQEELTPDDVTNSTSDMKSSYEAFNQPFVSVHLNMDKIGNLKDLIGTTFFINCCTKCCPTTVKFTDAEGITHKINQEVSSEHELEIGLKKNDISYYNNTNEFCEFIVESLCLPENDIPHVEFAYKDSTLYIYDVDNSSWSQDEKEQAYFCDSKDVYSKVNGIGERLWIQAGSEKGSGLWLEIGEMNTEVLGINNLDLTTIDGAARANIQVKLALEKLLASRGKIGAQQNRLEHTVANEDNISEKVGEAESGIRDTDLSSEMIRYSNLSILLKTGQAMIEQVNQKAEKILTVLR